MTVGLTLGKYAPLHRGHEFVFETALDEVDHLIVLVYDCPSVTSVPLSVRADWIRSGYPTVEVIEGWAMPTGRAYGDRDDERTHEQAIVDRLDGRDVDVFYSSEPYGGHVSDALDATDRRVDPERETVPISSTTIRGAPFEHRAFVPDRVYRDLITNVALLGGPSTGKTTLARHLAETFDTEWMPEYGREYWMDNQVDGILTSAQLVDLAEGHLEREDEHLCRADGVLFTDTNAITTLGFSHRYHGGAPDRLRDLASQCSTRYDLTVLCGDDIPYDDTWDREGEIWRRRMQKWTRSYLDRHNIPYVVASGSIDERIRTVERALEGFDPYDRQRAPSAVGGST